MSSSERLAFGAAAAALGAVVIYATLRRRRQHLLADKLGVEVDGCIQGVEQPAFVAATCEGLLVSEMRTDQVRLVSFTGSTVRIIGQEGWGREPLSGPRGLVSDGEHCWIVELANNRVQKFRFDDGLFCGAVGTRGSGHEQFQRPVAAALCGDTLFVSDTDNDRIVMLDAASLVWRGAFGKRGKQPGELIKPAALSVQAHRGELYVVEPTMQRVQVFSLEGVWLRMAVAPGCCKPRGAAAVPGALLVSESEGKRVLVVSQPEGKVLQELALPESVAPYGICQDEEGRVYVADSRANVVHVLRVKVGM